MLVSEQKGSCTTVMNDPNSGIRMIPFQPGIGIGINFFDNSLKFALVITSCVSAWPMDHGLDSRAHTPCVKFVCTFLPLVTILVYNAI